ncbi:hypothetical protein UA08_00916 [Talaromyces atroroseus]|uniref:Protein SYM1 n=1 Tax=Talaromyces atroroseus TaxID=1441469 RepID=A0A225BBM7_TALAT|nr:hypothetical protein UA08_00916 [Talaromyces atroroseus]OKL64305.1 hypothetical protein UA08_00916 [Talaromyces atroroseus]
MHRAITDLVSLAGRRPGNTLKNSRINRYAQRRPNSTKTDPLPAKDSSSSPSTATVTSPSVGSAASAAGAAAPPLRSRSIWDRVKTGPIGRFGDWYTQVQLRRPYTTQLASSFIIYLAGDLSAQLFFPADVKPTTSEESQQSAVASDEKQDDQKPVLAGYDPLRTLRHLTVGVVSAIPAFKWFMFLHHNFNYTSKFLSIATKVAVQQAVFTPVFSTYFFSAQSLLAGASLEETWERLKKALPPSIGNSIKLWPAVTAFSFMYVPPHFRAVFGGAISVGWQTYLSWLNQKAAREVAAAEAAERVLHPTDVRISQAA